MNRVYLPRRRSRMLAHCAWAVAFIALSLTAGYAAVGLSRIVSGGFDSAFYSAVMQ